MPPFGPIKRKDLIRCLRQAGFQGPYSGGKHQFMVRGETTPPVPKLLQADIGIELLSRALRQAGLDRDEWEAL